MTLFPCQLTGQEPNGFSLNDGGAVSRSACRYALPISSNALAIAHAAWHGDYSVDQSKEVKPATQSSEQGLARLDWSTFENGNFLEPLGEMMTYRHSVSFSSVFLSFTLLWLSTQGAFANPNITQEARQQTFVIETNMKTIQCTFVADETPYSEFFRKAGCQGGDLQGHNLLSGCSACTFTVDAVKQPKQALLSPSLKPSKADYRAGTLSLLKNKDGTFGPQFLILDDAVPWLKPSENPIVGFCESRDVIAEVARGAHIA